jgi:hypothetical protein
MKVNVFYAKGGPGVQSMQKGPCGNKDPYHINVIPGQVGDAAMQRHKKGPVETGPFFT